MDRSTLGVLAVIVVAAVAGLAPGGSQPAPPPADVITPSERAAGPLFALPARDQAWVSEAIASARPEAQALIAEIDGTVVFGITPGPEIGRAHVSEGRARIDLNVRELNGRRLVDRDNTVLHELGHVVDHMLVEQELNDVLEAGIPRTGACEQDISGLFGSCAEPSERFADTFAKWALRGRVSEVGAGYGVATPASLEEWGAPLATLGRDLAAQ